MAYVSGGKPLISQNRSCLLGMAVIAAHDIWSAQQNLTVFRDCDFDSFKRQTDRAYLIVLRTICGNNACFGGAITLENVNLGGQESIRQGRRKRRTPRH